MREVRIFPEAISHNVSVLHRAAGTDSAMMVVKADGYGHGIITAARAGLEGGAQWLGTADLTEALTLREAGIDAPILAWLIGPDSPVTEAIEAGVDVGVSTLEQLDQVVAAASPQTPATLQLKIDSGMGRGGSGPESWDDFFSSVGSAVESGRVAVRGMFTHFAQTSADSDRRQGVVFREAVQRAKNHGVNPHLLHSSSSTPALRTPEPTQSLVRLGISAYGVEVVHEHRALGLRPAMRLAGQIIQVKRLPAGHGVGYDHTYTTAHDTTVVVVPVGYGDGIPRLGSSIGPVSINGKPFRVSGRVSMDQVTIDVGDAEVRRGDWVVFFGDPAKGEPSVTEWANCASTIAYEVFTGVGARVRRVIR